MASDTRVARVAQQIQMVLAKLITSEIKDPRLGIVTITGVEVTRDFAYAKVYVVVRGDKQQLEQSLIVLNKAAKFLRRCLAKEILLRTVPELQFLYDESLEYGNRIDSLLRNIKDSPADE